MLKDVLVNSIFTDLTDSECITKLDEDVVLNPNNERYVWTTINTALLANGINADYIAVWNESINGLVGASMLDKMLSSAVGVNFSLPEVRGLIKAAISSTDNVIAKTVLQKCLDIGGTDGKLWQSYGLESLPTEQDIADAKEILQNQNDVTTLLNEVINPMVSNGSTVSEIKTAITNWNN